jgi:hypothetical protein
VSIAWRVESGTLRLLFGNVFSSAAPVDKEPELANLDAIGLRHARQQARSARMQLALADIN